MNPSLSIIVPILNEAEQLPDLIAHLQPFMEQGAEVILADGGSEDDSVRITKASGLTCLLAPRGRAQQMNAGAAQSRGKILVFVHADTRLPPHADQIIRNALQSKKYDWGRFDVSIQGRSSLLPVVAWFMNRRSRLSGIATGDQAMFVRRSVFKAVGGFPSQPLMEDVALSILLRRLSQPACLRETVLTSGRRWDQQGAWRTILLMWHLRFDYWRGVPAAQLANRYR